MFSGKVILGTFFLCSLLTASTYYVSISTGSDSYTTTQAKSLATPWKTIQKSISNIVAGDSVIVDDGVYTATNPTWVVVNLTKTGTSSKWITFKAKNKWKAILDGQNNATQYGWIIGSQGSYVEIQGFEFKNLSKCAIFLMDNKNIKITANKMHDIGRRCNDSVYGFSGVYMQTSDTITIDKNIFYNIGRYAKGENACQCSTEYYKNHDHGVYIDGSSNVTIMNNIMYQMVRGWCIHLYSSTNLSSSNLTVVNNTFMDPNPYRNGHIYLVGTMTGTSLIANNIFYNPTSIGVNIYPGYSMSNVTVRNNITHNGVIGSSANGALITGNINNTDPKLQNPTSHDARLLSGSPAINAGMTASAIEDFENNTRPLGGFWDIGAYEFIPNTSIVSKPLKSPLLNRTDEYVIYNASGQKVGITHGREIKDWNIDNSYRSGYYFAVSLNGGKRIVKQFQIIK